MADPGGAAPAPPPTPSTAYGDRRERRSWYAYDWANSAYVTTTGAVLFAPYLTIVAETAACGAPGTTADPCRADLVVGPLSIAAGSLVFYAITVITLLSAVVLPVVGVIADRSRSKRRLLAGFAWVGAGAASAMVLVEGDRWQLGVGLLLVANVSLAASLVVYDSILVDIAPPDERDRTSSRGWALGYAAGTLLLALNLGVVTLHDTLGITEAMAVRLSLLSAGLWWGAFTLIPFLGLRDREPHPSLQVDGAVRGSFGQLRDTLREARRYPRTLLFLLAYLLYNDGIQTVIGSASVYGSRELGFSTSQLISAILLVQVVAVAGALLFGAVAARAGARRTIMGGLVVWIGVVSVAYVLPSQRYLLFLGLATAIGLVMGGTQALSRSLYSQLVPPGREAAYFSLYQAGERGTSWLGTLVVAVVFQLTDSYRPAILALIVFFGGGLLLLWRLDVRRAIREAGNVEPRVV